MGNLKVIQAHTGKEAYKKQMQWEGYKNCPSTGKIVEPQWRRVSSTKLGDMEKTTIRG